MTLRGLAVHVRITYGGVRYHIKKLKKEGHLRHVKSTKAGPWEVLDSNPK